MYEIGSTFEFEGNEFVITDDMKEDTFFCHYKDGDCEKWGSLDGLGEYEIIRIVTAKKVIKNGQLC